MSSTAAGPTRFPASTSACPAGRLPAAFPQQCGKPASQKQAGQASLCLTNTAGQALGSNGNHRADSIAGSLAPIPTEFRKLRITARWCHVIRRCLVAIIVFAVSVAIMRASADSQAPTKVVELPGTYLKWIRVAETQLKNQALKVENYVLTISDEKDVLSVSFVSSDCPAASGRSPMPSQGETYIQLSTRGSCGTYPAYAVEVRKRDSKVVRSYYQR